MNDPRRVLITGATGGIGRALVEYFGEAGFAVLAHARTQARAEELATEFEGSEPVWGDLAIPAELDALADQVRAAGRLDWLVHNAGVLTNDKTITARGIGLHGEINVVVPVLLTRALSAHMIAKSDDPVVVVVSSSAANMGRSNNYGKLAEPDGSTLFGHYAMSKMAANSAVKMLAREFEDMRIYSTEPGFVKTDMTAGNASMPAPLRWASNVVASLPERAARRCFDYLIDEKPASGSVIQSGKPIKDRKKLWVGEQARANLQALLAKAGLN